MWQRLWLVAGPTPSNSDMKQRNGLLYRSLLASKMKWCSASGPQPDSICSRIARSVSIEDFLRSILFTLPTTNDILSLNMLRTLASALLLPRLVSGLYFGQKRCCQENVSYCTDNGYYGCIGLKNDDGSVGEYCVREGDSGCLTECRSAWDGRLPPKHFIYRDPLQ